MDRFAVFVPRLLPREECFLPEAPVSCKGCGESLAVRLVYKALGCEPIRKGTWKVPWKQAVPELKSQDPGEQYLPSLLRLAKADKQVLSICFDNEACTGAEGTGKEFWEKKMPAVAVAEGVAYVATASPGYPFDLIEKVKRAYAAPGDAYIHILCPCPVGWAFDASLAVTIGKLAVDTCIFPLYEIAQGTCLMSITVAKPRPIKDYVKYQGRFKNFSDIDREELQKMVTNAYARLSSSTQQGDKQHG
jgi:pyruvate/2-oxoacid:ferredoxin oxidoreductase beta subunit